jgi:5-methylcytosine-specific restriction protein A
MLSVIVHALKVAQSVVREHAKKITRSPKWNGVRKTALKANPKCAACGSDAHLQVHHIQPFHLKPTLELDPKNLIVLCMGPNECHFKLGHCGINWRGYNQYIAVDVLNVNAKNITLQQAQELAKTQFIVI